VLLRQEKSNGQFNYYRCKQQEQAILVSIPCGGKKKRENPILLILRDAERRAN
jgi:hypothetical protein